MELLSFSDLETSLRRKTRKTRTERLNLDISSGLGAPISEAVLRIDLI